MSEETAFGRAVERAAQKPKSDYLLMVWNVPDALSGLVARHGFTATKKNPRHWYRLFQPGIEAHPEMLREKARRIIGHLKAAGLQYSWKPVQASERKTIKAFTRQEFKQRHSGINFASHNVSLGWRMRQKRK